MSIEIGICQQLPLPNELMPKDLQSASIVDPWKQSNDQCDKCGGNVPKYNDAIQIDAVVFGYPVRHMFSSSRHFLPTYGCQGSPSRAQYIEGQPRDGRSSHYRQDDEILWRAAYAVIRAENGSEPITTPELGIVADVLSKYATKVSELEVQLAKLRHQLPQSAQAVNTRRPRVDYSQVIERPQMPAQTRGPERTRTPREVVKEIVVDGRDVGLGPLEARTFDALHSSLGQVVPNPELVKRIWGEQKVRSNLAMAVRGLRLAIETDIQRPQYIENVRGVGYRMSDPEGKIAIKVNSKSK